MMVLNLLFGLSATFMLLAVSAWLWLRDPAWPWTQPPRPKLQPALEAKPGLSPLRPAPSQGDDEPFDHTRIEAVTFPAAEPHGETEAEPTQILPNQLGQESVLHQPTHLRLETLELVEESSAVHGGPSSRSAHGAS